MTKYTTNYPWGEDFPSQKHVPSWKKHVDGAHGLNEIRNSRAILWSCREPSLAFCVYLCFPSQIFITGHTAISKGTSCRPSISNHFHAIVGFPTSLSSIHQFAKVWAVCIVSTQIRWSIHGDLHLDAYCNLTLHDREERSRMLQWSTKSVPRSKKHRESKGTVGILLRLLWSCRIACSKLWAAFPVGHSRENL